MVGMKLKCFADELFKRMKKIFRIIKTVGSQLLFGEKLFFIGKDFPTLICNITVKQMVLPVSDINVIWKVTFYSELYNKTEVKLYSI